MVRKLLYCNFFLIFIPFIGISDTTTKATIGPTSQAPTSGISDRTTEATIEPSSQAPLSVLSTLAIIGIYGGSVLLIVLIVLIVLVVVLICGLKKRPPPRKVNPSTDQAEVHENPTYVHA
ncbi:uncharacterized protein LOC105443814 [Strongylocentrotus purpuratus]|uniref:Uncharacterized protein n=1 Tax=Strongylocentrotus purpuratus TaxID=7668 RepID=A0A7M7NN27_STRPU|nr:uncharacterized protein LOC105443814 [Strongylocentrotus purpuratus]